jgi:hypothetical protein
MVWLEHKNKISMYRKVLITASIKEDGFYFVMLISKRQEQRNYMRSFNNCTLNLALSR